MMSSQAPTTDQDQPAPPKSRRHWHRLAFVLVVLMVLVVVVALPFAVRSMGTQLFGRQEDQLYDLLNNTVVTPEMVAEDSGRQTFINIGVLDVNEGANTITLGLSGNRVCGDTCTDLTITAYSIGDNPAIRRGLPPSASIDVAASSPTVSGTVTLPIKGQASLYPFDRWTMRLGLSLDAKAENGQIVSVGTDLAKQRAVVTLQNETTDMLMSPPAPAKPEDNNTATDTTNYITVQDLSFQRPDYLRFLAVILMVLIGISGVLALLTRTVSDLVLGVGGLIMGIWGIRGIMVPQPVPTVTAVDLALSTLILLILLGLAVRAAMHFHALGEFPWSKPKSTSNPPSNDSGG